MNDSPDPISTPGPTSAADTPEALVGKPRRFQIIWLIPLVAALVAAYLAYDAISKRGPSITISFASAEGLKAGQTKVRFSAVDIGTVDTISLAPDLSRVLVRVQMQREAEPWLTERARFWVVRPRLSAGNVSGLDTLLSGPYIEIDPGLRKPGDDLPLVRDFVGLDEPPAVRSNEPGQTYVLRAGRIGGISSGSPVLYRDIQVGEVLRWDLIPDGTAFTVSIFVRKPYDRFVHPGTYFWNSSGVGVDLGANGVQLRLDSLQALLSGAVSFDNSPDSRGAVPSPAGTTFRLYRDEATASAAGFKRRLPFVTRFEGSVRGLAVGAPVEIYGIQIGNVTAVQLQFDPTGRESHVDVRFEIQPERIMEAAVQNQTPPIDVTRALVQRGLRMQLHTANYLTGQMYLGMDFVPGAVAGEAVQEADGTIFVPGVSGGLDNLAANLTELSQRLSRIPFEQIGQSLDTTLRNIGNVAASPELKASLQNLNETLATLQDLVRKFDTAGTPALKRLPDIAAELQSALQKAGSLLGSANQAYGDTSQFKRDTERLLVQLNETARSVRQLADFLVQHPEALIQGRSAQTDK